MKNFNLFIVMISLAFPMYSCQRNEQVDNESTMSPSACTDKARLLICNPHAGFTIIASKKNEFILRCRNSVTSDTIEKLILEIIKMYDVKRQNIIIEKQEEIEELRSYSVDPDDFVQKESPKTPIQRSQSVCDNDEFSSESSSDSD
jgi:hypothetical protein